MGTLHMGIDWGRTEHQFCVVGEGGKLVVEGRMRADDPEWLPLVRGLQAEANDGVAVGIESEDLPLVDELVAAGVPVYVANPLQVDALRRAANPSGTKNDSGDARAIATSLAVAIEQGWFVKVELASESAVMLRVLTRQRREYVTRRTALSHQLKSGLTRYYPQFLGVVSELWADWVPQLWKWAPCPDDARRRRASSLKSLLCSSKARRDPDEIHKALKAAAPAAAPGVTRAAMVQTRMLFDDLVHVQQQIKACEAQIAKELRHYAAAQLAAEPERTHSDVELLLSLPGLSENSVAAMLGEANDLLTTGNVEAFRCRAGVAPIQSQTGKLSNLRIQMRRARNRHLLDTMYFFGQAAAQRSPIDTQKYAQMKARGLSHGRACRQIADGLLKVVFAVLRTQSPYDATRRQGVCRKLGLKPATATVTQPSS